MVSSGCRREGCEINESELVNTTAYSNEAPRNDTEGSGPSATEQENNIVDNKVGLLQFRPEDRQHPSYACPFCGKCVRLKENLKLHIRKHTGERPFSCPFCRRAFSGKSDLTRHLRIHSGERPYHCDICGKCFARADYLSKHMATHTQHSHAQTSHH